MRSGPDMGMHLDINFHFKTEGFKRIAEAVAPFNLTWLEIDTHDAPALADIQRGAPCPIASYETLHGRREFKPFFDDYATDVAIIDVIWNGLNELLKIASMADVYEVNVAPHNFYGHLCSAISAHFSAIVPNFRVMEIDIDSAPWRDEFYATVPDHRERRVRAADRPWLGHRREREGGARASAEELKEKSDWPNTRSPRPRARASPSPAAATTYEMEPLEGVDAEIVEGPTDEDGFIDFARTPTRSMRRACSFNKKMIDGLPAQMQRHRAGQRRCGQCRCGGGDRERHSGHQLPRHLHRGGRRPRDGAAAATFRRAIEQDSMVREGRWREGRPQLLNIPRLMGQTLGLVAFGHVARAVAKRAKPFGLRIMAYDPFIEELVMLEHGVIPSTLEEVLSQSRLRLHARAGDAGSGRHAGREALQADEEDRDVHQHRPWADGAGRRR